MEPERSSQHLITEHSLTQNTGRMRFDVLCGRHKPGCHYLNLILLCREISVFAQLRFNLPASVCWQQYYLPHIIMPLSLLLVTSSHHVHSHLLFTLIIACFLSRTVAAILER